MRWLKGLSGEHKLFTNDFITSQSIPALIPVPSLRHMAQEVLQFLPGWRRVTEGCLPLPFISDRH